MEITPTGLKRANRLLPGVALIAAVLSLAACGDKTQPPVPQTAPPQLFQQERGALDKAKGVEQTEAKSAEDLKQEAEKQAQ